MVRNRCCYRQHSLQSRIIIISPLRPEIRGSFIIKIYRADPLQTFYSIFHRDDQGAFCKVCSKTVVDFSGKSDEEVKNYFFQKRGQRTCGRFRNDQLFDSDDPLPDLLIQPLPFWKKFLAIVLVVFSGFLTSCHNQTQGKIKIEVNEITLGETDASYVLPELKTEKKFCPTQIVEDTSGYIVGVIIPDPTPAEEADLLIEQIFPEPDPIQKKIFDENGNEVIFPGKKCKSEP